MMKTKGQQNRFLRIITIPIRALGKARDFYVKSITNYADRGSCYGGSAMGIPPTTYGVSLPRSYSATSSRSYDSEDFKELLRAASSRSLAESTVDLSLYMQQEMRRKQTSSRGAAVGAGLQKMPPRSCSVGMGRIDEDKPCCAFGEENMNKMNQKLVYPRSRSYAVNKKSLVF